jgi:hypothetical protein
VTAAWNWDRQALEVSASPGFGLSGSGTGLGRLDVSTPPLLGEEVSAKTASRAMLAKLIDKLNQRLTGSASVVGDTRLRPGASCRSTAVGQLFGGPLPRDLGQPHCSTRAASAPPSTSARRCGSTARTSCGARRA